MLRLFACAFCLLVFCGFAADPPITGKWSASGNVRVGDARIELTRKYVFPCTANGYIWTEMKFDTIQGGKMELCRCGTSPVPPGTITLLWSACTCMPGKWSFDSSTSTLTITDSTTVHYLVSSITDSSMVLIKK